MKIPKQAYTAGLRERAVKRVKDGPRVGTVGKELGLSEQTGSRRRKARPKEPAAE